MYPKEKNNFKGYLFISSFTGQTLLNYKADLLFIPARQTSTETNREILLIARAQKQFYHTTYVL